MPQPAIVATPASTAAPLPADGRARRAERSGRAIVGALIELVGEGVLDPTAEQVAARAGVGLRTVFRRFSDMEGLFAEMSTRVQGDVLPLLLGDAIEGDVVERARTLVARRVVFFERIARYKRAATIRRWRSPYLQSRHAELVRVLRADLLRRLPELRRAPAALVDALELATSFEAWDRLRVEQRAGRARAHAAVERTVVALVAELAR
jgi:AcrR family transcriptional regulator